jgi:hypothetical protein
MQHSSWHKNNAQAKNKKKLIFFDCISTMINILIIFLTQYFQEKKSDLAS